MKLSVQQEAVLDWVSKQDGSLNLVARAGCGKTSTLIEVVRSIPEQQHVTLCAFNKAIAEEVKSKLQMEGLEGKAEAATMHSLGLRAWKRQAPKCAVEGAKVYKILDSMNLPWKDRELKGHIAKLVSYAKQALIVPARLKGDADYTERLIELGQHFGIDEDFPLEERNLELVRQAHLTSYEADEDVVDFDDMLAAPLLRGCVFSGSDWVLLDEAQDTNAARQELALAMLDPGSRLIAVGDPRQAIYGFTGAMSNAMGLLAERLGSIDLPLNHTFRCAKTVVAHAQQWVPDIYAYETNPEGSVSWIEHEHWLKTKFKPTDVILCRLNRPIVALAYQFIRDGVGCRVEGRDIGQGILKLAKRFKTDSLKRLRTLIELYRDEEVAKFQAKYQDAKAASVQDKCDTLIELIVRLTMPNPEATLTDLEQLVSAMFGDTVGKQNVLTLSTVHKSKGREWDRVYLLGRNAFMPLSWAKDGWELEQEHNLIYVAVTRAKHELVEVVVDR